MKYRKLEVLDNNKNYNFMNEALVSAMLATLKKYPQNHIIISIRAETLIISMNIFKKYFFNNTSLNQIKNDTGIKTISFYIDGKCKIEFYNELVNLSNNFTLYINTRIVKTVQVNVQLQKMESKPTVNVFIPFAKAVDFISLAKYSEEDEDFSLGETIAIDASSLLQHFLRRFC